MRKSIKIYEYDVAWSALVLDTVHGAENRFHSPITHQG